MKTLNKGEKSMKPYIRKGNTIFDPKGGRKDYNFINEAKRASRYLQATGKEVRRG